VREPFFFAGLVFDQGILIVRLEKQGALWANVQFEIPRAFRFFNESDNYSYLENYNGSDILDGHQGCCISKSVTAPYLKEYLNSTPATRLEDGLMSIIIITPQECVEVISFETPSIEMVDKGVVTQACYQPLNSKDTKLQSESRGHDT
jgi:hypothetical protein